MRLGYKYEETIASRQRLSFNEAEAHAPRIPGLLGFSGFLTTLLQ